MKMQAIQTRYLGPSNVRGSRVKAFAAAGSITLSWDHRLMPKVIIGQLLKPLPINSAGMENGSGANCPARTESLSALAWLPIQTLRFPETPKVAGSRKKSQTMTWQWL